MAIYNLRLKGNKKYTCSHCRLDTVRTSIGLPGMFDGSLLIRLSRTGCSNWIRLPSERSQKRDSWATIKSE